MARQNRLLAAVSPDNTTSNHLSPSSASLFVVFIEERIRLSVSARLLLLLLFTFAVLINFAMVTLLLFRYCFLMQCLLGYSRLLCFHSNPNPKWIKNAPCSCCRRNWSPTVSSCARIRSDTTPTGLRWHWLQRPRIRAGLAARALLSAWTVLSQQTDCGDMYSFSAADGARAGLTDAVGVAAAWWWNIAGARRDGILDSSSCWWWYDVWCLTEAHRSRYCFRRHYDGRPSPRLQPVIELWRWRVLFQTSSV